MLHTAYTVSVVIYEFATFTLFKTWSIHPPKPYRVYEMKFYIWNVDIVLNLKNVGKLCLWYPKSL